MVFRDVEAGKVVGWGQVRVAAQAREGGKPAGRRSASALQAPQPGRWTEGSRGQGPHQELGVRHSRRLGRRQPLPAGFSRDQEGPT